MRRWRAVLQLLRVREWAKNTLIFAPLVFTPGQLGNPMAVWSAWWTCVAFCAVSSSAYILNDIVDRRRDRAHPVKRARPLVAGAISVPAASLLCGAWLIGGLAVLPLARIDGRVLGLAVLFVLLNLAYTCYLKHKVIADVFCIALGYVVRVLAGGAAIHLQVTHWLLLCTFLLATFLAFSKRRHELVSLDERSRHHRPVLHLYSEEFLDRVSILTLAMTLTCYILYTIAPETVARFGTHALVYSSLLVMFGLFRYLFLIHVKHLGSPVEILYYDRQIVLAILAWVVYVVIVAHVRPAWPWLHR